MNAETMRAVESIALVMVGWLLSTLTIELRDYRAREKEKRKIFTRLWLVLEAAYINLEVVPVLNGATSLEITNESMGINESLRRKIPAAPPSLTQDFDTVLESVMEWESARGQNQFTKQLNRIHFKTEALRQLYKDLSTQTIDRDPQIFERGLAQYIDLLAELKNDTFHTLKLASPLRFRLTRQFNRKIQDAFQWGKSEKIGTRNTTEAAI